MTTDVFLPAFLFCDLKMDDKELEYRALLEQVTRDAERQAALDMQNHPQPPEPEEFVGNRNGPGNILNRLGSRVAPMEERILCYCFV